MQLFDPEIILSRLTVEEKLDLLFIYNNASTPIERLTIPSLNISTLFYNQSLPLPCNTALAATFNKELLFQTGKLLANDARSKNLEIAAAPCLNLMSSPLSTKIEESLSEDPYLNGFLVAEMIKGIQSEQRIAAIAYCCDERLLYADEYRLRQLYFKAIEVALKNSTPDMLLWLNHFTSKMEITKSLIEKVKFEGLAIDYNNERSVCPFTRNNEFGNISQSREFIRNEMKLGNQNIIDSINKSVLNSLKIVEKTVQNKSYTLKEIPEILEQQLVVVFGESIILLKNDANILPLLKKDDILVIDALPKDLSTNDISLGDILSSKMDELPGGIKNFIFNASSRDIQKAEQLAKENTKVVLCIGNTISNQGVNMLLESTNKLVEALLEVNKNIVVINYTQSAIIFPWLSKTSTLIQAWENTKYTNLALADILFGDKSPCGKLPITFPSEDTFRFNALKNPTIHSIEKKYIGYKLHDKLETDVAFCFGHGLTYTEFDMTNWMVDYANGRDEIYISFDLENTGDVEGTETMQIYTSCTSDFGLDQPLKELRDIVKITLKPEELTSAKVTLSTKDITSVWDNNLGKWHARSGFYCFFVGDSSDNDTIALFEEVELIFQDYHWI